VDPGSRQLVVNADVTIGSPGCASNACTILVSLTPGAHTFDVRTYDAPLVNGAPQGNVLSQNLGFPFTVKRGVPNQIGVVLQGLPQSVLISQTPGQDVAGNQDSGFELYGLYQTDGQTVFPRTFELFALDADGNVIAGPGSPQFTMSSSSTGVLSNGAVSATGSNRFVVTPVSYSTSAVTFTVTATPSTSAGTNGGVSPLSVTTSLRLAAKIAPRVYVTDQTTAGRNGKLWVFDELGKPVANVQANIDAQGSLGEPDGVSYSPGNDTLLVAGETSHAIFQFDSTGRFRQPPSATGKTPLSLYYDPLGEILYVGNEYDVVTEWRFVGPTFQQTATSGDWKESGTSAVPAIPWGITVTQGLVALTDASSDVYQSYTTDGTATAPVTYYSSPDVPFGITNVTGVGAQYLTFRDENLIRRTDGGATPGGFPNLNQPFGLRQDPVNGYLYVVNFGYAYAPATLPVTRYDTDGNPIALPAGAFAGPEFPLDIEIVP
ncbi:MAG: hypothetical protein JOY98_06985, partial [Candidatus Eremiobacteraeota bacterium]|nr:hypothetical protein [Candidatus Eremiobacteraeota bacterium]